MNVIFLGVVMWNILLFLATIYAGIQGMKTWHFSLGMLTGIFTCFTHCLVFIQLIGSGKGIKEAVETHSLPDDPETGYIRRSKKIKARAMPMATFMPLLTIIVAWLGAWHDTNRYAAPQSLPASYAWHMGMAWVVLLLNLWAFWKEYEVLAENTRLIGEINEKCLAHQKSGAPVYSPDQGVP